jgi:MFS transporter, FSR family, fosmidomycin resistance protein
VPRSAALPAMQHDLALSYAQIGLLLGVPVLASALIEPVLGVAGDTGRRRALITAGGAAFAASMLIVAGAPAFWAALAGMAVNYPASGAFVGLSQAALMDLHPSNRAHNMSRWVLFGAVGAVAGPLAVAVSERLGFGWRPAFAVVGVAAAGLALAVRRVPSPASGVHPLDGARDALRALRDRRVVRWLALLECADLLVDVMRGFLAVYLVAAAGTSPAAAAGCLAILGLVDALASGILVWIVERVEPLRIVRAGALAALVSYPAALLAPWLPARLACFSVVAAATAGWYPLLKAQLYDALPERSGSALALGSVSSTIAGLVPPLLGLLAARYGVGAAMWVLLAGPVVVLAGTRSGGRETGAGGA